MSLWSWFSEFVKFTQKITILTGFTSCSCSSSAPCSRWAWRLCSRTTSISSRETGQRSKPSGHQSSGADPAPTSKLFTSAFTTTFKKFSETKFSSGSCRSTPLLATELYIRSEVTSPSPTKNPVYFPVPATTTKTNRALRSSFQWFGPAVAETPLKRRKTMMTSSTSGAKSTSKIGTIRLVEKIWDE